MTRRLIRGLDSSAFVCKSKARYFLLMVVIALVFTLKLLKVRNNVFYPFTEKIILHPPTCLPQAKNDLLGNTPKYILQQPIGNEQSWKLLYCCVKNYPGSEKFCGRYGCCPTSCYSNFTSHFLNIESNNNNVFFLEASGASALDFKEACVVESLAKHNSDRPAYVLFTAKVINVHALSLVALLENYNNLKLISLYPVGEYFTNTPLENWYFCSGWNHMEHHNSHLNDALRFLTLSKFGGYFVDFENIFVGPFLKQHKNFVAYHNGSEFSTGIMHINKGHSFAKKAVEEFATKYRADSGISFGSGVIWHTMTGLCKNDTIISKEICQGISLLPLESISKILYQRYPTKLDAPGNLRDVQAMLHKAMMGDQDLLRHSKTAQNPTDWNKKDLIYNRLASANCPFVYKKAFATK